jgi:hypothetical protein
MFSEHLDCELLLSSHHLNCTVCTSEITKNDQGDLRTASIKHAPVCTEERTSLQLPLQALLYINCFQINMSRPRPIHQPPREIRSQPDEAEPSYSYEQESFLLGAREEAYEDDFHRRLQSTRRDTGGSFWRTSSNSVEFPGPNFSSMSMKQRQDSIASTTSERKTSFAALQPMQSPEHIDPSVSVKSS